MTVARLTFSKIKPEASLEDARKIWDESVIPAAMSRRGFVGGFLLAKEEANESIGVTLWESEDHAYAGEQSGYYQEQVAKFQPMMAAPPERKLYKVNSRIIMAKE